MCAIDDCAFRLPRMKLFQFYGIEWKIIVVITEKEKLNISIQIDFFPKISSIISNNMLDTEPFPRIIFHLTEGQFKFSIHKKINSKENTKKKKIP